ncbi:hypothetical protein MSG28_016129 [Choristoneura fumiferana]|uniref:Uncharacterized protein n=1 Tax=Choristoneura fumiferana TaxID=7141 RepID=A0ACC0K5W6_CHOFU|nr:hypothetical protein MSG28_016129 [Choristoneura fumiferana]
MFTNSEGVKTLMPNAVPLQSSNDEPSPNLRECSDEAGSSEELVACRVCLAADGRLYAISGSGLEDALAALTGVMLPVEDTLPRHLCVFCMARLSKCAAFRDSCRRSTALLQTLLEKGPLKMNVIKAFNRKLRQQTNNLTCIKVFHFGTDSFIEIMPLIKNETSESLDEEAKCAETEYIDSENIIKKDASDVNVCALELPIEKRERPRRNFKSRAKHIMEYIKVELGIDDNADSELDDTVEPGVNDSSDVDSDTSEETLAAVKKRKKSRVTLVKENTAEQPKKCDIFNTEDKHPTDVDTDRPEATTKLRKSVGIKSANTSAVEKKNNRKTKALSAEEQKEKVVKRKKNNKPVYSCDLCEKEYKSESSLKMHKSRHDPDTSKETLATFKKDAFLEFGKKYNFEIKLLSKDEQKQRIQERLKSRATYGCDVCGKDHCKERTLMAHKTSYHDPLLCLHTMRTQDTKPNSPLDYTDAFRTQPEHPQSKQQVVVVVLQVVGPCARSARIATTILLANPAVKQQCLHCCVSAWRSLPFECDVCFYRFRIRQELRKHQLEDRHRLILTCNECRHVTRNRTYAKEHYLMHRGKTFACPYCELKYDHQSSYYGHIRQQHPGENEACDQCGETFAGKVGLLVHKRMQHKNDKPNGEFKCKDCDVKFSSGVALQRHLELSAGAGAGVPHAALWPCAACGDSCGSDTALKHHTAEKHPPEQHYCQKCNKTFSDAASFALHVERKHRNRRASYVRLRERHARVVCEVCGKVFMVSERSASVTLDAIAILDTGECLATLQYHMNVHLGLTPYQCQHCPKAFTNKFKLQIHMRIHTGEKPYKCEQCPQAFSARGNFTRHMKNVHLRVQVECDKCGKTMGAGSLTAHIRAVHMNQRQVRRKRNRTNKTQARIAESVPSSLILRAQWVLALGPLRDDSYVCSRHFDETMFMSRDMKKLAPNAVPMQVLDTPLNKEPSINRRECFAEESCGEPSDELVACRACLAADGRLYAISGSGLEDTLAALTGAALPPDDSFPRHLCVFCMARLSKCAAFRDSCRRSTVLLRTLLEKGTLKMNDVKAIDRNSHELTYNLACNKVFEFSTDPLLTVPPEIKTESDEGPHEVTAFVDVECKGRKDSIKNDVDRHSFEVPIEKHEVTEVKLVKLKTENSNAHSEAADYMDTEVKNDTSDYDTDSSEETLAAVKRGKRKRVKAEKENTSKNSKKCKSKSGKSKISKVTKAVDDVGDKAVEAPKKTRRLRKTVGVKTDTETAFEKKFNCKTKLLSKEEQKQEVEERKRNNKSAYSCELCGKGFKKENTLMTHKSYHDPSLPAECDVCRLRFRSRRSLLKHQDCHRATFTCNECGNVSRNRKEIARKRPLPYAQGTTYTCPYCQIVYNHQTSYYNHIRVQHPGENEACDECGETFAAGGG